MCKCCCCREVYRRSVSTASAALSSNLTLAHFSFSVSWMLRITDLVHMMHAGAKDYRRFKKNEAWSSGMKNICSVYPMFSLETKTPGCCRADECRETAFDLLHLFNRSYQCCLGTKGITFGYVWETSQWTVQLRYNSGAQIHLNANWDMKSPSPLIHFFFFSSK